MKSKLALLVGFFVATPLFLLCLILYQVSLYQKIPTIASQVVSQKVAASKVQPQPALPTLAPITVVRAEPKASDLEPRVAILKKFLGKYNSPLEAYSQAIVDSADNYGLDWRLLPAIAMQESTLCKRIPKDSFNCWGFGIYGGKVTRFSDYGEAINVITRALARDYHANGLEDPNEMVKKYTPANTNNWSGNVSYIMGRIATSVTVNESDKLTN